MRYGVYSLSLVVVLAVAAAADQNSDKENAFKQKAINSGVLEGTLTELDTTNKWFTVKLTQKTPKGPNVQAQQNLASLNRQLVGALRSGNAGQVANIKAEIAKNQNNLTLYDEKHYNFDLKSADNLKVRLTKLPVVLDDKGKPKKYTQKERDALKGPDRNLPGYQSEFGNLKTGQKVKVTLSKKKEAPRPSSKDKDADKDDGGKRLTATMIEIKEEEPSK
jgi:hypothetical protein